MVKKSDPVLVREIIRDIPRSMENPVGQQNNTEETPQSKEPEQVFDNFEYLLDVAQDWQDKFSSLCMSYGGLSHDALQAGREIITHAQVYTKPGKPIADELVRDLSRKALYIMANINGERPQSKTREFLRELNSKRYTEGRPVIKNKKAPEYQRANPSALHRIVDAAFKRFEILKKENSDEEDVYFDPLTLSFCIGRIMEGKSKLVIPFSYTKKDGSWEVNISGQDGKLNIHTDYRPGDVLVPPTDEQPILLLQEAKKGLQQGLITRVARDYFGLELAFENDRYSSEHGVHSVVKKI